MPAKITKIRALTLMLAIFSAATLGLAITPHRSCACGAVEDGTKLTYIMNVASEKLTGKRIFPKNSEAR